MARRNLVRSTESIVRSRYAEASKAREAELCCPVTYDPRYLKVIPKEILERDYGCGDPSRYLRAGDTVLDLGSGGGKICYIASQIVGPKGRVIGLDFNPDMLSLARRHQKETAKQIGHDNVTFHRARIQDLALALDAVDRWLSKNPVTNADTAQRLDEFQEEFRRETPLIPDGSVDVIISNCVLNLVREEDRESMFREMFRVLKKGGRVAISDIVSDEVVDTSMKNDPDLWSGCISGAFQEAGFLGAFERAGFHAVTLDKYDEKPWRTVRGVEFRSATVTAEKGKQGSCWERNQAVIYKGPWKRVEDDDGHVLLRGRRMAVCDKTFRILTADPYGGAIIPVPPMNQIALSKAKPFACGETAIRPAAQTKGKRYAKTITPVASCDPNGGCC